MQPAYLQEPAAGALLEAYRAAQARVNPQGSVDDLFEAVQEMVPAINRFFEDILVMAEERELRESRLALLQRIAGLARGIVDLTKVEGF